MFARIIGTYREAYRGLPGRAWVLFAVNLVNSSGSMVIFFLTLYLTRKLGFSASQAGRAMSFYGLGSLGGAYFGGWLADRIGSTSVQKISLVLGGFFLIGLGQSDRGWAIAPALFVFALVAGALYPANGASMSRICPADLQVKGFALNRLANTLGATIGPAIGGILALRNYRLLFWVDGLTCLAAAAVFALLWRKPELELSRAAGEAPQGAPRGRSPWRDGPFLLLMLVTLVWSTVFIQVLTTLPLYMRDVYGLAENRIGTLFAVNTVLIVTLEMILMEKIRRFPLTRMINISFLLLGAGLGLMPLGRGAAYAGLTVAVWTFGEMLSMPLLGAVIAGRADDASRGRYMGIFSFAFSLAFILAPALGTAVYSRFGGSAVWFGSAAVCLLLAGAFSLLRPSLDRPVLISSS